MSVFYFIFRIFMVFFVSIMNTNQSVGNKNGDDGSMHGWHPLRHRRAIDLISRRL